MATIGNTVPKGTQSTIGNGMLSTQTSSPTSVPTGGNLWSSWFNATPAVAATPATSSSTTLPPLKSVSHTDSTGNNVTHTFQNQTPTGGTTPPNAAPLLSTNPTTGQQTYGAGVIPTGAGTGAGTQTPSSTNTGYTPSNGILSNYYQNLASATPQTNNPNAPQTIQNPTGYVSPTVGGISTSLANQQNSPYNAQISQGATGLLNSVAANNALGQNAQSIANQYTGNIQRLGTQAAAGGTLGNSPMAAGAAVLAQNSAAAQEQAQAAAENAALAGNQQAITAQGQAQSGLSAGATAAQGGQGLIQNALGTAGGLVTPSPAGYGQAVFNPVTGTYSSGTGDGTGGGTGGGAGNLSPQSYASQLAQQVIAGTLPYTQAQSLMGYAGGAGSAFLQQAITAANPNFNFGQAQSNAQAQGTIGPQAQTATQAIAQLQSAMQNAPWYQTTGIPAINAISGLLSTVGLGTGSQASINDARNEAVQTATSVLGTAYSSAGQVTPTSLTNLVQSWFPPNPTPSQVQAGIQQFNQRLASITSSFTSPGTVPLPGAGGGAGTSVFGASNFQ